MSESNEKKGKTVPRADIPICVGGVAFLVGLLLAFASRNYTDITHPVGWILFPVGLIVLIIGLVRADKVPVTKKDR